MPESFFNRDSTILLRDYANLERSIVRSSIDVDERRFATLESRYVHGILLARLKGITCPFAIGDSVVCINLTRPVHCHYETRPKEPGSGFHIVEITWDIGAGWLLVFNGHSSYELWKASDFRKKE
jgi:hypothetical protein